MLGEAYANFGVIGIALVPCIMGYYLTSFYFRALRHPYFSVYRFMYVIWASCLVLVFRDGLQSLVVFPVVDMMPLVAIALLSYIISNRRRGTPSCLQQRFAFGHAGGTTKR